MGAVMCPFAWSGFLSTVVMLQVLPQDRFVLSPSQVKGTQVLRKNSYVLSLYEMKGRLKLFWKWLLHCEKFNQIKNPFTEKNKVSSAENQHVSQLPAPLPFSPRKSPAAFQKKEILSQLFLRNWTLFKFLPQTSSKKTCLFCLVHVSKSGVADLPSSPAVRVAQLQTEPDFRFRFGS